MRAIGGRAEPTCPLRWGFPFAHVQWTPSAELVHAMFPPALSSDGVAMSLRASVAGAGWGELKEKD